MASCDSCVYNVYDEDDEEYYCEVDMDEDDAARLMQGHYKECPYYQLDDEYAVERAGLERGIPASEKARRLLEESEKLPAADKSLLQLYRQTQERKPGFEKEPEKRKDIDRIYQEVIYKLYQGSCSPGRAADVFYQDVQELFTEQEATDESIGKAG